MKLINISFLTFNLNNCLIKQNVAYFARLNLLHFSFKTVHSVGKDCLRINRTARGNILSVFLLQYKCQIEQMTEIIIVLILTFILGTKFDCNYHKFSI